LENEVIKMENDLQVNVIVNMITVVEVISIVIKTKDVNQNLVNINKIFNNYK